MESWTRELAITCPDALYSHADGLQINVIMPSKHVRTTATLFVFIVLILVSILRGTDLAREIFFLLHVN